MSKLPVNVAVPPPLQQQQQQQKKKNTQSQNQNQNQNQNPESGEWTDEKLVDALKRLDDLHSKLISLRTVIPRLTLPLSTSHPSPAELYEDLSSRALGASEEVLTFKKLFVDSTSLFEHANQSRATNPQGIQAVPAHDIFYVDEGGEEEVVEEAKKDEDTEMKEGEEEEVEEEEVIEDTMEEDVEGVLDAFRESDGRKVRMEVEVGDAGRVVKITLPPPADLLFMVDIPSSSSSMTDTSDPSSAARRFIVSSVANAKKPEQPTPHLYTSILRSITTRLNAGNLQLLLEMLTTYTTIYTAPCKKCGKMTAGSKVELPVVRCRDTVLVEVEETAVGAGGKKKGKGKGKVWAAYHEACM